MTDYARLATTHDLSLPDWGPYSKRFFGLSHLADPERGDRFDFTVVPGVYRRALGVPDALRPSGYLPWSVAPDLTAYAYRQQLEWKDQVYADVGFFALSEHARLVRCVCHNRTALPLDFGVHFLSALVPEPSGGRGAAATAWCRPRLRSPRGLVFDCLFPGERREAGTVRGSAFAAAAGEEIRFDLPAGAAGALWLRLRFSGAARLACDGRETTISGDGAWRFYPLAPLAAADGAARSVALSADRDLVLDGLAVTPGPEPVLGAPRDAATGSGLPALGHRTPQGAVLSWPGARRCYGVRLDRDRCFLRSYAVADFNQWLLYRDLVHQTHFGEVVDEGGKDCFCDMVVQPLRAAPGEKVTVYALVVDGAAPDEAAARLAEFPADPEAVCRAGEKRFHRAPANPGAFSQERMAAVVLSNVVYPTYFCGAFARHHTPGRCWNSLYTWDSGFIGLAMLEISRERALESLNAYLTPPGDPDNAFVLHGAPVPTQIYLFHELLNRGGDRAFLEYFYPRVKQYYDYLAGRAPGSLTRAHCKEDLLCTWDYFYNSGGWDDYPPQRAMHARGLPNVVPVVTTAHVARCAKILARAARELGRDADAAVYDGDAARFAAALQKYAWDEEEGTFAYTVHDQKGNFAGIFRHESGRDFNLGLDGAMPLVVGCATAAQRERLWARLESPAHCWTATGLSTVDQSAPYFSLSGYWNGCVWMPYQWFFWKAALDDGRGDFAWKIAATALAVWEREVQASYACYEQLSISSGRGNGWHHFSALSGPVLNFAAAYHAPGTLTGGFDFFIRRQENAADGEIRAALAIPSRGADGATVATALAVVDAPAAVATYAGRPVPLVKRGERCWEMTLPRGTQGELVVRQAQPGGQP